MPTHYALPRNHACRMETKWVLNGIDAATLENELLRVTILTGKGGDVYEFLHKPTDTDFMWKTARGLPSAGRLTNGVDPRSVFVEYYHGGWQELFPHGSSPVNYMGTTMYQHGEVSGLPFDVEVVADTPRQVALKLVARMRQTPMLLEKTYVLKSGSPVLEIRERATNLGKVPLDIMWGHHPAFSSKFLEAGCRVYAPIKEMSLSPTGERQKTWPYWELNDGGKLDYSIAPAPGGDLRTNNMVYATKLSAGWYALHDPERKLGFGMTWDHRLFPYIWMWRGFFRRGKSGFPNYGHNEHTIAIEPFSSLPYAHENKGRMLHFGPGKSLETVFRTLVITGVGEVNGISRAGKPR